MVSDEDEYTEREPSSRPENTRSESVNSTGISNRTPKQSTGNAALPLNNDSDDDPNEDDEDEDDIEMMVDGNKRPASRNGSSSDAQKKKRPRAQINDQLKGANGGYAWEDEIKRSWDIVKEDKDGSLKGLVSGIVEANKMKKIYKNVTPFQRGIIRTLILVLDCSQAMLEKDLRPNRYSLTITYALEFVTEFFDQNPISQLGIVAMRNGVATVVSDVSGNPIDHINNLKVFKNNQPEGDPSLQNALEMARGLLLHTSPHSTKEVLILFGTLFTSDPGDIFKTVNHLVNEKIRVRIIGLNAQVSICSKIVSRTNFGNEKGNYGIVLNEQHFKELLHDCVTPLPVIKRAKQAEIMGDHGNSDIEARKIFNLIKMGFPKRISEEDPSFCSCHSNLNHGGYICPFCKAKICSLPAICLTCNLMLISSTHLARSYHHLFPLKNFQEVLLNGKLRKLQRGLVYRPGVNSNGTAATNNDESANGNGTTSINSNDNEQDDDDREIENMFANVPYYQVHFKTNHCYACQLRFPVKSGDVIETKLVKTSSRYECPDCHETFCIDCNVFIHETLHNCPGCESKA